MMNKHVRGTIIVLMCLCVIIPIVIIVMWAFANDWRYPSIFPSDYSIQRFINYIKNSNILVALGNSILLSSLVTLFSLILGYYPAKILGQYKFRGKTAMKLMVFLPAITPGICVVYGMIPVFINLDIYRTFISILLAQITFTLPYMILMLSSAFKGYDDNYEKQSYILGVNKIDTFLYVTLPRIKSGVATACMFTFMVSWAMYLLVSTLAPTNFPTMITEIMPMLTSSTATIYDVAITALLFFAPALVFLIITSYIIKNDKYNSKGE